MAIIETPGAGSGAVTSNSSEPPELPADVVETGRRRPSNRTIVLVVAGVAALAAAALIGRSVLAEDDTVEGAATETQPIQAVTAEVRDLAEFTELDATLAYGDPFGLAPSTDGTITEIADEGEILERGEILWVVDDNPTVLFQGSTPLYRPLTEGAVGDDVLVLEENLAALGYTNDGNMVVDRTWQFSTTVAVNDWLADLGREETGTVAPGDVVVERGPVLVSSTDARVGDSVRAGTPILQANLTETTETVHATAAGLVTDVVSTSDTIEQGAIVYEIDTIGVPVIVGEEPVTRDLSEGVADGADIEQLERALVELGFDPDGNIELDDVWDEATTTAWEVWEDELGLEVDGVAATTEYVRISEPGPITDVGIERGDEITPGAAVVTAGTSTKIVTTEIGVADQDQLRLGQPVEVEFPDDARVTGTVTFVGATASAPAGDPTGDPVLPVEVTLDSIPETAVDLNQVDVEILLVDRLAEGAVVVPASALISTGQEYVVEVVSGSTTSFVAVDTGMFADGFVEVVGIEAGTAVVVPR